MATRGSENNQSELGYEGCVWGTTRVTMGPHEPQSTLRRSSCSSEIVVDGEVYIRLGNSQRRRECEDVESPLRALGQGEEVTEELVTRLAVHSTADGKCPKSSMTAEQPRYFSQGSRETQMMTRPVSSVPWQSGDAVRICTSRDPEAQRVAMGRHVTIMPLPHLSDRWSHKNKVAPSSGSPYLDNTL